MRNILLLLISVIGLALLRNLIREIGRFVVRSSGRKKKAAADASKEGVRSRGRLARDPQTGTYVDPADAVRAKVGGTVHFFESEESRDAYMRAHS